MSHDSWVIKPLSELQFQNDPLLIPNYNLCSYTLYNKPWIMNRESWLTSHPTSKSDSQFQNHTTNPHLFSLCLYTHCIQHESWVMTLSHPTSSFFGRGRAHYCPDQFLKVSLRLGQALGRQPSTSHRNLPSPQTPLYTFSRLRRLD